MIQRTASNVAQPPMTLHADKVRVVLSAGGTMARINASSVTMKPVPPTSQQIERRFVLPERKDRTALFFRAIEIADLMFSLSVLEHGAITGPMTEEAVRAVSAYLRTHFPASLPRRRT